MITVFEGEDDGGAPDQEDNGGNEGKLGIEGEIAGSESLEEFVDHGHAEAADDH